MGLETLYEYCRKKKSFMINLNLLYVNTIFSYVIKIESNLFCKYYSTQKDIIFEK